MVVTPPPDLFISGLARAPASTDIHLVYHFEEFPLEPNLK